MMSRSPDPAGTERPPAPAGRAPRPLVYGSILVTGAATLALELIAARMLTPYVGGGLIVWTAILAITLLALAAGYHLGSRWSARDARGRFVLLPALAAIVLGVTAAGHPALLPGLTGGDALAGAFVGALLILAPALVLLGAMGPLGIALIRGGAGDAGAGEVFAVSTVGSILGVFLASFGLLPFMAPTAALCVLGLALAGVAGAGLWALGAPRGIGGLLPAGLAAAALAGSGLAGGPEAMRYGEFRFRHVATERSAHATIIVADARRAGFAGRVRLYLEENQIQSGRGVGLAGHPIGYVATARALIGAAVPPGGRVLVLGLAGGVAASDLARSGYAVRAVEINPRAVAVARRWFDLAPEVEVVVDDARRHLGRCRDRHDAIFVDVFDGLETPAHLVTREFFAAAARCLAEGGAIVVNAVVPPLDTRPARRLLAALSAAAGGPVAVYQDEPGEAGRTNRMMLARPGGGTAPTVTVPDYPTLLFAFEPRTLAPHIVRPAELAGTAPLSDASNDFALSMALTAPPPPGIPVPAEWY
jgi:predicted membrane-bound spermidine synthase